MEMRRQGASEKTVCDIEEAMSEIWGIYRETLGTPETISMTQGTVGV
jgi:hypothetical protein